MNKNHTLLIILFLIIILPISKINAGEDTLNESDLKEISKSAANYLNDNLKINKQPFHIYICRFTNRSESHLDTNRLTKNLYYNLKKTGKQKNIEHYAVKSSRKFSSAYFKKVDYYILGGEINRLTFVRKNKVRDNYYVVNIELVNAVTSRIKLSRQIWITKKDNKLAIFLTPDELLKQDIKSNNFGPYEVITAAGQFAKSLQDFVSEDTQKKFVIMFRRIRNKTSWQIKTNILANEIISQIKHKKISFITNNSIIQERSINDLKSGRLKPGYFESASYNIGGDIRERRRKIKDTIQTLKFINIKMYHIITQMTVWSDNYEVIENKKNIK